MYAHTFKISILPKIDKKSRYKVLQKQTKINKDFIEEPFEKNNEIILEGQEKIPLARFAHFVLVAVHHYNGLFPLALQIRPSLDPSYLHLQLFFTYRVSHNHCPIRCCNSNELIREELWDTLQLCKHPVHLTGYFHDNKRGRRKGWQI